MTDAVVRIRGRNELGKAVAEAERDLRKLVNQGQLLGKLFKGGALIGAFLAFERLAERAQEAAEKVGDKGTAKAVGELNKAIDELKAKGTNVIGQVLGTAYVTFAGTEGAKITLRIAQIQRELTALLQSVGGDPTKLGPGFTQLQQELARLQTRLEEITPEASDAARALARMRAISRGGGSGILVGVTGGPPKPADLFPDVVTAQRAGATGLTAFYNELERQTRTSTQAILAEWEELELAVAELRRAGIIDATEQAKRLGDISTRFLEPITITAKRMETEVKEVSGFAIDAANEMRNAFAEFLNTSSNDIDDWASNFLSAMRQILAQWAAFETFTFLSGFPGLGFLAPRAAGGPVRAGGSYLVGEHGPERFVPSTSGMILPNGAAGGVVVAQTINIDARGATMDLVKVLPAILEQHKRETVALAVQATRNRIERTGHL